jgi:hypothetical protein
MSVFVLRAVSHPTAVTQHPAVKRVLIRAPFGQFGRRNRFRRSSGQWSGRKHASSCSGRFTGNFPNQAPTNRDDTNCKSQRAYDALHRRVCGSRDEFACFRNRSRRRHAAKPYRGYRHCRETRGTGHQDHRRAEHHRRQRAAARNRIVPREWRAARARRVLTRSSLRYGSLQKAVFSLQQSPQFGRGYGAANGSPLAILAEPIKLMPVFRRLP